MEVEICRYALDRVPLSLIVDDSAPLVNINYFFMRDAQRERGVSHRWEDVPVVIPESFTRTWAEWCAENGVKGKFSVVPCPAGLGRIDEGLPLFSQWQLDSWLQMCREIMAPSFDITPEMLTHTHILDTKTLEPLPGRPWEQVEWVRLPEEMEEYVTDYIKLSCQILQNVGLEPTGVTAPGGFGGKNIPFFARVAGRAVRAVTGKPTPFFFKQIQMEPPVPVPVWYADKEHGTAVGEIIATTGDWTGSWTGYDEANVDRYITADLKGGCLPTLIDAGSPAILCSHWQGFYGLHDGDRRGFRTLQTVVNRLAQRDPNHEHTRWCKVSEITDYACARHMASVSTEASTISLDLPLQVPNVTLRIKGARLRMVRLNGLPLTPVCSRSQFKAGTFLPTETQTLLAFNPEKRQNTIDLVL